MLLFTRQSVSCGTWLQILSPQQGRVKSRLFVKGGSDFREPEVFDRDHWWITKSCNIESNNGGYYTGMRHMAIRRPHKCFGGLKIIDKKKIRVEEQFSCRSLPETNGHWMVWFKWCEIYCGQISMTCGSFWIDALSDTIVKTFVRHLACVTQRTGVT